MSTARAILVTLRPRQWAKNSFVVAPLVFSKHLFDASFGLRTLIATAAFCALSGAAYAFNDLRDVEQDRNHPINRNRPIAAGALSERAALVTAALLALCALGASAWLSLPLAAVAGGYLVLNLAYSLKLKQIAFLDVGLIACFFLLRVTGGAFAIDVDASPWLLACTALLAGLLGFGKRAHELSHHRKKRTSEQTTRVSLKGYSIRVLRICLYLLAVATSAAYALYTLDDRTVGVFGTHLLIWTLPFCVLGIARFLYLALLSTQARSPTDAILRDWPFIANIAMWGAAVLLIIYWGSG